MQQLRSKGCEIRALQGQRLHAKVLMAERGMLLGSTNFTTASQRNVERGVALYGLGEEIRLAEQSWFDHLFGRGVKFAEGMGEPTPPSPVR